MPLPFNMYCFSFSPLGVVKECCVASRWVCMRGELIKIQLTKYLSWFSSFLLMRLSLSLHRGYNSSTIECKALWVAKTSQACWCRTKLLRPQICLFTAVLEAFIKTREEPRQRRLWAALIILSSSIIHVGHACSATGCAWCCTKDVVLELFLFSNI